MLAQEAWTEYIFVGIIFGASCIIDLIISRVMRRRLRQRQQHATACAETEQRTENVLGQDEELAKWEDIALTSKDPREKVIAISQVGLMGNVDDIELLNELANMDPDPNVQVAIKRAIEMLKAKLG